MMWFCASMKLGQSDPRTKQALAEWAQVAPTLGMNADSFRPKLIWQKHDAHRSHVVIRLRGRRRLILKRVFDAPDDAELQSSVAAQIAAFSGLEGNDAAHAPEVVHASDDAKLVVMVEAKGKTLNDHLVSGRAHGPMLRRTGAWLSAFHGAAEQELRTYQPKYMVHHAARMAAAVSAGDMAVAAPDMFVACCERIPMIAKYFENQPTLSAVKHGDFNLRNILLGSDGETGLDFKPVSSAPVGFDIARLLMDYAELFQPLADVPAGSVLSQTTLDAFFEGYELVSPQDPAVQFLPYVQLLNDWRLIPVAPSQRSWRQSARMDRITQLAQNAFGLK